jgi:hypothetical protein
VLENSLGGGFRCIGTCPGTLDILGILEWQVLAFRFLREIGDAGD